jgi:3',5'-cyclic AMP phosphodiesterase CpdA
MHPCRMVCAICVLTLSAQTGCSPVTRQSRQDAATGLPSDSFVLRHSELARPLRFVVYGDMRFTTTGETELSNPGARQALVARVALEHPDALFLTGDVPLHGGNQDDYREFAQETAVWRAESLRVFPVLGNHEFQQCAEPECLEHWWQTFPQLQGRRWYGVSLGSQLQFFALDSDASLMTGSEQARWLGQQLDALPDRVRFVLFLLHHPPLTDASRGARTNEEALAAMLAAAAAHSRVRFIVCAAHVHNYERFERDGIVFLVSGGGGAKPVPLTRSAVARYRGDEFPNFHYLRFELTGTELHGEMVRLTNPDAAMPGMWAVKDQFEVHPARPESGPNER